MSKPLELTIYEYDREQYGYVDPAGWIYPDRDVDYFAEQKRLTEAELCAEYWRHEGDYRMLSDGYSIESFGTTIPQPPWVTEDLERDRVATLHRFATHPHYFEATEPESDTE